MDKISMILISAISVVVLASGYMVCSTWLAEPGYDEEILVFSDDMSVINNSTETLWIRAQITEDFAPSIPLHINEIGWTSGEDGWYYYMESLKENQCTVPFAKSEDEISADAKTSVAGSFRVKVEAVEQSKLPRVPNNGKEAFLLLKREKQKVVPILL